MTARALVAGARALGHAGLWLPDRVLAMRSERLEGPPPVFIIGPPRSGTSLLYELMVTRYRFAYISNLAHRFYLTPLAASWAGRGLIRNWHGDFTSKYGHISGWGAPNEGGWVWRRWLADGEWTDGDGVPDGVDAELRVLTQGLAGVLGAPFLNKNVMHSNRLLLMNRIWPNALFVEVVRAPVENARSIIRAERKEAGPARDAEHWWSVKPRLAKLAAGKSVVERAAAQVLGVRQDIARDMAIVGSGRLLSVDYADVCSDCPGTLARIGAFLERHGVPVLARGPVPERFHLDAPAVLNSEDERELAESLERYSAD